MKKIICSLLAFAVLLAAFPLTANATKKQSGNYVYKVRRDGTVKITLYKNLYAKTVKIPSKLDGRKVTVIGKNAFNGLIKLKKVKMSDTVTKIEKGAFRYSAVSSVRLSKNLRSIGDSAFGNCMNLKSIKLGNKVEKLGEGCFRYTAIKTIKIPASVKKISAGGSDSYLYVSNAFAICKNLESIKVSPKNKYYSSKDGVLFNKDKTKLIMYPEAGEKSYKVPSSVKKSARARLRTQR